MIDNRRVIVWTPYGRKNTVSILVRYLERDYARGLVDEYWLYLNTDPGQDEDLRYAYELARDHDWIHLKERPEDCPRKVPKQRNTGFAYRHFTDPDAVYVRMDDDLVYLHDDAISNLVTARLAWEGSVLCAFPIIINNAVVSWHLQQQRRIPGPSKGWPSVQLPYCMDAVGWADGDFAVRLHRLLLDRIQSGTVEELYMHHPVTLAERQQFSVSCFATLGSDYAGYSPVGNIGAEEEFWHSVHRPAEIKRANIIVENALVSHWSFYHQHAELDASGILEDYRALADKL
jgi:hypothetical protein